MYDEFIDQFIQSGYLSEYLKSQEISGRRIADIIYYAPNPIHEKQLAFGKLAILADKHGDKGLRRFAAKYYVYIKHAMELLWTDGVFSVESESFCESGGMPDTTFETLIKGFDAVKDYIIEMVDYVPDFYVPEDTRPSWYSIEKWEIGTDGQYHSVCSYIMLRDVIYYADIDDDVDMSITDNVFGIEELYLPVPYKPGDLLEVDGFPFSPKIRIVILDVGDNMDCCCVQALSKNDEGEWQTGAVKHGMIGVDPSPQVSPLYTADIYDGPLNGDNLILGEVSRYINGNQERADKILKRLYWGKPPTDEELLALLKD